MNSVKKSLLMASLVLVSTAPALSNTQAEFNKVKNNVVNAITTNAYVSTTGNIAFNKPNEVAEAFLKVKSFYKKHPNFKAQLVDAIVEAMIRVAISADPTMNYNVVRPYLVAIFTPMVNNLLDSR